MSPTKRKTSSVEKIRFSLRRCYKMDYSNKKQIFGRGFTIDELLAHMDGDKE
jgi:ribosomal protein L13E